MVLRKITSPRSKSRRIRFPLRNFILHFEDVLAIFVDRLKNGRFNASLGLRRQGEVTSLSGMSSTKVAPFPTPSL